MVLASGRRSQYTADGLEDVDDPVARCELLPADDVLDDVGEQRAEGSGREPEDRSQEQDHCMGTICG